MRNNMGEKNSKKGLCQKYFICRLIIAGYCVISHKNIQYSQFVVLYL